MSDEPKEYDLVIDQPDYLPPDEAKRRDKPNELWVARDPHGKYIGSFPTPEEADDAFQKAKTAAR